jgi:citrate lyase subunit beta / citryl-CoA lyase
VTSFDGVTSVEGPPEKGALVRRSALILPANVSSFVEKAHRRGADAIVLDLEDSVSADEKEAARETLPEALKAARKGGVPVLVRVNSEFLELVKDLDACVRPQLDEVMLPKAESADQVKILDALLRERELLWELPVGRIKVNLVIESTLGLEHVFSISQASKRAITLALGGEDLKRELNLDTDTDGDALLWAHSRIVLAARAASLVPLGYPGSISNYHNIEEFQRAVEHGRRMGYAGGYCIHPRQVEVLNRGFSSSEEQVAWAQKVVDAFSASLADGRASISVDGQMVDTPVAERARGILEWSRRIREFDARKPQVEVK